jgi:hypothetical protein
VSRFAFPTITAVLLLTMTALAGNAPAALPTVPRSTVPARSLPWPQVSPASHREVSLRARPSPTSAVGQPALVPPAGEDPEPGVHLVPAPGSTTSPRPASSPLRPDLGATGLTPGFRL